MYYFFMYFIYYVIFLLFFSDNNKMSVPDNTFINDIRDTKSFKSTSFSGYKLTDVKKQLIENMKKGKIEPACYWSAELVCSGHFSDIWECIIFFVGKYINIANPKITLYLDKRYTVFKNIMNQKHFNLEIDLRNNLTIRNMFAEIISILATSNKKTGFEAIKINKDEEFDLTSMKEHFKAKDTNYANEVFFNDDAKELFIPINEFAFSINQEYCNVQQACYWIEWIIEFDIKCRKIKLPCKCRRRNVNVDNKFQTDSIWIVWDVLINKVENHKNSNYLLPIMKSLREIFCAKYSLGTTKKRKFLLYYAVQLISENINFNIEIVNNKELIQNIINKINEIYKQIKKEEVTPKTDYLFNNLNKKQNLENSIAKINMIDNMDFIPRND